MSDDNAASGGLSRRRFNQATLLAALFGTSSTAVNAQARRRWSNWSGYLSCEPQASVAPRDTDELAKLLREAKTPIRPVGAGHSFTPLVPTDGTILSLRRFTGVEAAGDNRARIGAGMRLGNIGEPLHELGLGMANMPDIDEQSFAGAIATATHGTGAELTAIHDAIHELELVTPEGETIKCSRDKDADIFHAAQVSLGSLGVITHATLNALPSYKLVRKTWLMPLEQVFDEFEALSNNNRSFEFYYVPFGDKAMVITTNLTDRPVLARTEEPDNDSLRELQQLRDLAGWWPGLRRWLLSKATDDLAPEEHVDYSHRIFPSDRSVRFNEMEYHLPREDLIATLKKVRSKLENNHPDVFFPLEVRVVREDDAWLSPFYGRPSGSIAVHRFHEDDPLPLFRDIEPLYQQLDGRPHWGKMHTLSGAALSRRYPKWTEFHRVRKQLDPNGRMLNDHLRFVFGA